MQPHDLPPELVHRIACCLETREDAVSYALTCRYLYSVLCRLHIQYIDIRSPLCKPSLWKQLAHDDSRASLIRSLTILPENTFSDMQSVIADYLPMVERTPEEYRECSPVDDGRRYGSDVKWSSEVVGAREHELGTALRRMQNLHQFRWFRPLPPVSTGEDDLWTILKSLGTVRALHILDLHEKCLPSWPSVVASSSFLSFCGLTSLTLRSEAMDRISEDPDVTPLLQMLVSNCPALENVRLHLHLFTHIETAPADVMVRDGQWPNLTSLYLEGFNCQPTDLAIFLGRHSGLRELRLPCMMPGYRWKDLVLPSGSLPNLRTLECHSPTASALLSNGEVATNLVTLQAIDLHDVVRLAEYFKWDYEWEDEHDLEILELQREIPSPWKAQLLEGIRAHPSITWLELDKEPSHSQVAELAEVAPQITELSFCGDYDRKGVECWHEARDHSPRLVPLSKDPD